MVTQGICVDRWAPLLLVCIVVRMIASNGWRFTESKSCHIRKIKTQSKKPTNKGLIKSTIQPKRQRVSTKRNTSSEDNCCYIWERDWKDDEEEFQSKWVVCETNSCPKCICNECLPINFDYKKEFICNVCKRKN